MALDTPPETAPYRITLFFGPEPVDDGSAAQACVFNVKKRSWKAGIQVSVDIATDQLTALQDAIRVCAPIQNALAPLTEDERADAASRIPDLAAQAIAWCKLDLRLTTGLQQENQRIRCDELVAELNRVVSTRQEYVVTYILTELDLMP